jgi:hypothetical protein
VKAHTVLPHGALTAGESETLPVTLVEPAQSVTVEIVRGAWMPGAMLFVALSADTPDGGWRELAGCVVDGSRGAGTSRLYVTLDGRLFEAGTHLKVRLVADAPVETEIRLIEG